MGKAKLTEKCTFCQDFFSLSCYHGHRQHCEIYHEFTETRPQEKVFRCHVCEKNFPIRSRLTSHMITNHKEIRKKFKSNQTEDKKESEINFQVIIEDPCSISSQDFEIKKNSGENSPFQIKNEKAENLVITLESDSEPEEISALYICKFCNKNYGNVENVRKHLEVFHKIPKASQNGDFMFEKKNL